MLLKFWVDEQSQFHYGSIKTELKQLIGKVQFASQFHYGSIKTKTSNGNILKFWGLNSTMVRLKLKYLEVYIDNLLQSQFHYGSIKTQYIIMVVLLLQAVSIPLWFD